MNHILYIAYTPRYQYQAMASTALDEYLERYAGDEYAMMYRRDVRTRKNVLLVFRIMGKSEFKYSYTTACGPDMRVIHMVVYVDGTRKQLFAHEDEIIRDRGELGRLVHFRCTNMEIVDVIGSPTNNICIKEPFLDEKIMDIGDIFDNYLIVCTLKTFHRVICKEIIERLSVYLLNKR